MEIHYFLTQKFTFVLNVITLFYYIILISLMQQITVIAIKL